MAGLNWDNIEALSIELEAEEGWDSIHTMRTNYPVDERTGARLCIFPGCGFRRHDPRKLFIHGHFGPHGQSYGVSLTEFNKMAE